MHPRHPPGFLFSGSTAGHFTDKASMTKYLDPDNVFFLIGYFFAAHITG